MNRPILCLILLLGCLSPAHARTFTDFRGHSVTLKRPPQRIASTALAGDEILIELLSRQGQTKRLVAVSTLADDPKYSNISAKAKKIPARTGRDLEALLSLKPDLVFLASYNQPAMITRLQKSGVPFYVLSDFTSLKDIKDNIQLLGEMIGAPVQARNLLKELQKKEKQIKKRYANKQPPSVLNFSNSHTLNGMQTTFDDIVTTAGLLNAAHQFDIKGWAKVSIETLAGAKPDFIVAVGTAKYRAKILASMRQTAGYKSIPAVKEGRVILVPENKLLAVSHYAWQAADLISQQVWAK